jgi:hypothetical protein
MGQRSGVGLVELAILEALDAQRAWPGRRPAQCRKVLAALEDELGLARGYSYQVLIDLALPWKIPIPLVEGQGNFGSRGSDPPASPYYTEARLAPAGQVALGAERGEIAPVPIGLINGNTHRQGTRPPFRPTAVIDAIGQVLARPRLTARQITALVGPRLHHRLHRHRRPGRTRRRPAHRTRPARPGYRHGRRTSRRQGD